MDARSIEILVVTDEPSHASYLKAVLQLELPGRFEVRRAAMEGLRSLVGTDLVVLLAEPGPAGGLTGLPRSADATGRPPVIVVASAPLDLDTVGRLILDGADDVIDMARLTPRGLAAAVLKAVGRHAREPAAPGHIAASWSPEGVLAVG